MKKALLLFGFVLTLQIFFKENVFAGEAIECNDRYVTLVNPVRSRDLWLDKSLKPIEDQYDLINAADFPATWLLQYDVFLDPELLGKIKEFGDKQEIGLFLEVSQKLGDVSRVVYPINTPGYFPNAVFLSGYEQSERRKLIDTMFQEFKNNFGYYPKSVGAWWIDSYSLTYLKQKYDISGAMIVADQKTTDNYGVWGQWWGAPYYPSKVNILTPADNISNKEDVVITQWAQRDPLLSYGDGSIFSNYSLQANDYIRQGKDTSYFKEISLVYLDCKNLVGQITVGLETGIESIGYIKEYQNQIEYLKNTNSIQAVTMSEFAQKFKNIYPEFPTKAELSYKDSKWILSLDKRLNTKLNDEINYSQEISFNDYFLADQNSFLDRRLVGATRQTTQNYYPVWTTILTIGVGWFIYRKQYLLSLTFLLFTLSSFGLLLRSNYQYGWKVYFGPSVDNLLIWQIMVIVFSFLLIFMLSKFVRNKFTLILIPLSFGVETILTYLRFSFISDRYYFGILIDTFRFIGINLSKSFQINFINQDLPAYQAEALLKFNFNRIWENNFLALFIYPVSHILIGLSLGLIFLKFNQKTKKGILVILSILFVLNLLGIFQADPRAVVAIY
ncbi:MAG: hypothetical protein Q7R43_05455 [Candidatus Daviesbacteria bacterium]|nr:hypothetical protein [Candidatus Daviesbacteria bacterium]